MKNTQEMTKIEKAALDLAVAFIKKEEASLYLGASDGSYNRKLLADDCRDLAKKLMDPEPKSNLKSLKPHQS